jgi:hypothetical protein
MQTRRSWSEVGASVPTCAQAGTIVEALHRNVDFSGLQRFQVGCQSQTELSKVQKDMTMACLFHFNLSLTAVARWIGGSQHAAKHWDNDAIFARLKETSSEGNYREPVRLFTKGSPAQINSRMLQADYKEHQEFCTHAASTRTQMR